MPVSQNPDTKRFSIAGQPSRLAFYLWLDNFPWWLLVLLVGGGWVALTIFSDQNYQEAFSFIYMGISITIYVTLVSYGISLILGLLAGLGRISRNVVIRNIATLYVEVIRGIPMLVLIFYIAFVGIPGMVGLLLGFGQFLDQAGLSAFSAPFLGIQNDVSMDTRAIIALAITYGAYLAEIFRAGIQSIGTGQMEAARSLGMSYWQAMRYIILPQAIRNVLPALGNDFVAMIKDSSLVSVLAVRDITQTARLYAGRTFRFPEAYTTLAVLYLTMTVILSLLIRVVERRLRKHV
jgi:polar amino acid transport system permease protein